MILLVQQFVKTPECFRPDELLQLVYTTYQVLQILGLNRINGAILHTSNANTVGFPATTYLFRDSDGFYMAGKFYEFIMFNRVLFPGERALVNAYVYARYGIVGA